MEILLVDDDPSVCHVMTELLNRKGLVAEGVLDAEQALARLRERSFDIVVADFELPGANGAQLLAWVRGRHPHIRRVMISGCPAIDGAAFERSGLCHCYLAKPCGPLELMQALFEPARREACVLGAAEASPA